MKTRLLLLATALFAAAANLHAQGTAFTYQGQLNDGSNPANGSYDLRFHLYNASSGGAIIAGPLTNSDTPVSNGVFTVTLDFGAVYDGTVLWLQIAVRTNGGASFTALSPRQELTPTPYAITAENVDGSVPASQLTGTLPSGLLSGTYGDSLTLNNAGNTISGNGSGLTGVNAATLSGLGPNSFWQTTGNAGTTPGINFLGTTDGQFLEVKTPFVGINRTTQLYAEEILGVHAAITNVYAGMDIDTAGVGLPYYGYAEKDQIIAYTYLDGLHSNNWSLNLGENDVLTATTNDEIGIGTTTPASPLDLQGQNNWNLSTSEGDFRIGDSTYRLKMGVALGGGGAGDSYIRAAGGTSRILMGSLDNNVLTITTNGVGINDITPDRPLDVINANSGINSSALLSLSAGVSSNQIPSDFYAGAGEFVGPNGIIAVGDSNYFGSDGVVGISEAEGGDGVFGSSGSTEGSGVWAVGASPSSAAVTIGTGALAVLGAGTNTQTTAFIQVATAANTSGYITTIYNSVCDGNPKAILIATHNWNPPGVTGNYETHPYSVYYTAGHWTIYNDDSAAILGMSFNVLVILPKATLE